MVAMPNISVSLPEEPGPVEATRNPPQFKNLWSDCTSLPRDPTRSVLVPISAWHAPGKATGDRAGSCTDCTLPAWGNGRIWVTTEG